VVILAAFFLAERRGQLSYGRRTCAGRARKGKIWAFSHGGRDATERENTVFLFLSAVNGKFTAMIKIITKQPFNAIFLRMCLSMVFF
jgi:hypothetical protein